jgi:uncharacterized protein
MVENDAVLHPHTELRYIDPLMGYGVFATRPILRGTVTWVRDDLDQTFTPERFSRVSPPLRAMLDRYSFVDREGDYVLCWDHARYLNHGCEATCLSPGYGFEIAVRDIAVGEELTDDYGTLNIDVPFDCGCSSTICRGEIRPDDLLRFAERWDALLAASFFRIASVQQPLWDLVREKEEISRVLAGQAPVASCRHNFHHRPTSASSPELALTAP